MKIILAWLHKLFPRRQHVPSRAVRVAAPALNADDDRPLGCGWFDSSHELQCGLVIQEHATGSTLAAQLPLAGWIELQLSIGRQPQPA